MSNTRQMRCRSHMAKQPHFNSLHTTEHLRRPTRATPTGNAARVKAARPRYGKKLGVLPSFGKRVDTLGRCGRPGTIKEKKIQPRQSAYQVVVLFHSFRENGVSLTPLPSLISILQVFSYLFGCNSAPQRKCKARPPGVLRKRSDVEKHSAERRAGAARGRHAEKGSTCR
jgi:hypothetical protein